MAKRSISPAGPSEPSTVSAAALRLGRLLANIRDGLRQFLDAFQLAIQGARREEIKWPLFVLQVPDPGDGGTIQCNQLEAEDSVNLDNFGICLMNIPVAEDDISTATRYLKDCALLHDAQRLDKAFKDLKDAFCSPGDQVQCSDGSVANRKFYAQACAATLWKHVNDLIGTVVAMCPRGSLLAEDPDQMVSHGNIAKRYGFTSKQQDRLRKKLEAWRTPGNCTEWTDVQDRKPRQPRYLYRLGSVQHLINEVKASG